MLPIPLLSIPLCLWCTISPIPPSRYDLPNELNFLSICMFRRMSILETICIETMANAKSAKEIANSACKTGHSFRERSLSTKNLIKNSKCMQTALVERRSTLATSVNSQHVLPSLGLRNPRMHVHNCLAASEPFLFSTCGKLIVQHGNVLLETCIILTVISPYHISLYITFVRRLSTSHCCP